MSGWSMFAAGGVCAIGVLMFLRITARAVEQSECDLTAYEVREQAAWRRRGQAEGVEEVVDVHSVGNPPGA